MELIEFVKGFIRPELLVLVPVLYFVGSGLKSAHTFADRNIPIALGAAGVLLAALWVVATTPVAGLQEAAMAAFLAFVQGVLVAGASVYINQIVKQMHK